LGFKRLNVWFNFTCNMTYSRLDVSVQTFAFKYNTRTCIRQIITTIDLLCLVLQVMSISAYWRMFRMCQLLEVSITTFSYMRTKL